MNASCPVCGEPIEWADRCPSCGAILPDSIGQDIPAVAPESAVSSAAAMPPAAEDELLEAFCSQFTDFQIVLPRQWTQRLHRLAGEAEPSRRHATVIFVDLRRFTSLSCLLSEEQLDQLLKWFFEVCTRRVEMHGGFVIKLLGDAMLAAFGAPWAFERDTESALRALLDIREDVRHKGEFEGHPLTIRAGAASGPVSVRLIEINGRRTPDIFGSPVNLAARLEAAADTWEILISDTLAAQVQGIFELETRAPFLPNNYSREVIPHAVKAHRGAAALRRRQDLRLVGRQQELAQLQAWVSRARAGEFIAARIEGPAGIGKTRLALELLAGIPPEAAWIYIHCCEPHARYILLHTALAILRHICARVAGSLRPETPEAYLEALAGGLAGLDPHLLPSLGFVLGVQHHIRQLKALPPEALRTQVVQAMVATFEAAADHTPWVLFIDDTQWCDPLSVEILSTIFERHRARMLLLSAGRPAPHETDDTLIIQNELVKGDPLSEKTFPVQQAVLLNPLDEGEARQLLAQVLDLERLHPLLRARLLQDTEGFPLYLVEMAHEVENPEFAARMKQRLSGAETTDLPQVMVEILQSRFDHLSLQRRALLQCGAVIGRRFSLNLMELFNQFHDELLSELYALKGIRLLAEIPLPADTEFMFTPGSLRDIAYGMLLPEQRRALHRILAENIERHFGERVAHFAYELALHWIRAGNRQHARRYIHAAARQALELGSAHDAHALLDGVLGAGAEDAMAAPAADSQAVLVGRQQEALLHELAGRACRLAGELRHGSEHFEACRGLALQVDNSAWQANALQQLAINAIELGDTKDAEHLLGEARQIAEGSEHAKIPEQTAIAIAMTRGLLALRIGQMEPALALYESVLERLKGAKAPSPQAGDAFNNAGLIHWLRGDLAAARACYGGALDIWTRLGEPIGQVATLSNLGIIAEKQGRWSEARAHYRQALDQAEKVGYLHGITAIEANLANLAILGEEWKSAQEHAGRALHFAHLLGHRQSASIALENLGLALSGLGLAAEALTRLDEAIAYGECIQDPSRRDSAWLARIWVLFSHGRDDEARDQLVSITQEVSPELTFWRQLLELTGRSLDKRHAEILLEAYNVEQLKTETTSENRIRCLDAMILVAGRLNLPARRTELQSQRRAGIGNA